MHAQHSSPRVAAIVTEVLPEFGLAYLAGDNGDAWTITKSTPGDGWPVLVPGLRTELDIAQHGSARFVAAYSLLR